MNIGFIDTVGLRFNPTTVHKKGLGGSESAIIFMAKELSDLGFNVTVYNKLEGDACIYDNVHYIDITEIHKDDTVYDILIASRSTLPLAPEFKKDEIRNRFGVDISPFINIAKNAKHRCVWLHDTFIYGEDYLEPFTLDGYINEIFTLSDWHTHYICQANHYDTPKRRYDVLKKYVYQTRNGVNNYIDEVDISKKDKNLFIYNSSLTKGMYPLLETVWPEVKKMIPEAKLIVVGGYYKNLLENQKVDESELKFKKLYNMYHGKNGVEFTGIITQREIAKLLEKCTFLLYPADFPETYGISTLEAINYNVLPITCNHGALEEVAVDRVSYKINYDIKHDPNQLARFIQIVNKAFNDTYLKQQKQYACNEFKPYISWSGVALQWKYHFYQKFGLYMGIDELRKVKNLISNVNRIFNRRHLNPEERFEYFVSEREREIVVITPVYNAEAYISKCIDSVAAQDYTKYTHLIRDDGSTDNTVSKIHETIDNLPSDIRNRFIIIDGERKGSALYAQIDMIAAMSCVMENCSDVVFVLLDGDDWLANDSDIFSYINKLYDEGASFTYGSCHSIADNIDLISQPYPEEVINNKSYRDHQFTWGIPYTHLRTFSYELYSLMDLNNLKDKDGNIYGAGGDGALFYELIELCNPEEIKCVQRVLYMYNDLNPLNDYKVNKEIQDANANAIKNRFNKKSRNTNIEHGGNVEMDNPTIDMNNLNEVEDMKDRIVIDARNKDPKAIELYKKIASERTDAWIDNIESTFIKPRLQWVLGRLANSPKNIKILDVGAWTGAFANELYKAGFTDITCMDISSNVVKLGEATFPHIKWIHGDIEKMLMLDQYDIILASEILEHLSDPMNILVKLRDMLNPQGAILYTTPTPEFVFGDATGERSSEHISKLDRSDLLDFTNDINVLYIQNEDRTKLKHSWFVGVIPTQRETRILLALPTAKYIESETFMSIYNLVTPPMCIPSLQCFYGYNVAQVRNLIAHHAIENKYDYVFCIDSDVVLPRDALIKLINTNAPMASGVYVQRKLDKKVPEIYKFNDRGGMSQVELETLDKANVIDVDGCGFGCVLVNTNVFKQIGYPQFVYHNAIDHANTISEDVDFCMKVKKAGIKIVCDTSIRCLHKTTLLLDA